MHKPVRTRRWWELNSLSQKLTVSVTAAMSVLFLVTIGVSYEAGRKALEGQTSAEAMKQVQATALTMDSYVDRVAQLVRAIAARQEGGLQGTFCGFPQRRHQWQ